MGTLVGKALPHQYEFIYAKPKFVALVCGLGCVAGSTKIYTEYGLIPISHITPATKILSLNHQTGQLELAPSSGSFPKGVENLHQVSTQQGGFAGAGHHQIFSSENIYQPLSDLCSSEDHHTVALKQLSPSLLHSISEVDRLSSFVDVTHYSRINEGLLANYGALARLYGQLLLSLKGISLVQTPLSGDALEHISGLKIATDDQGEEEQVHIRHDQSVYHRYKQDYACLIEELAQALASPIEALSAGHISDLLSKVQQFHPKFVSHHSIAQHFSDDHSSYIRPCIHDHEFASSLKSPILLDNDIIQDSVLEYAEPYWDIQVLNNNNYICENGFIHHNSGKTEALIYSVLKDLSEISRARIGIYEPTIDLIKRILYPRFEEIFAASGLRYKLNKSEGIMEVWFAHGKAELIFRSLDNYSRIIGFEHHKAYIDELDVLSKEHAMAVWVRIMARNRKKFDLLNGEKGINQIKVTTTPEGFRATYELWVKDHAENPDYLLLRGRTQDNHHLPDDYVEALLQTFPPQLKAAYLDGEFVNMANLAVYTNFNRKESNSNLTMDDFSSSAPLHIGFDFNVGRMAGIVGMKSDGDDVNALYVVDEFTRLDDTPSMILAVRNKYPDRTIIAYPDASGRSRKSVDASKSDIRLMRDAGFRINAPKKNPPVRERVVSVNAMFQNAHGDRNLFVNVSECPNLTQALEQQAYDDNGMPVKDGKYDDMNDALGYMINRVAGLSRPRATVGRMRFSI